MRLNPDTLLETPSYINPLKDRELDLRGRQIQVIENLGVVRDQNGAIDMTDNEIRHLSSFPYSTRLTTLLLGRNRIHTISPGFGAALPNLRVLVLASNMISQLADLDGLRECSRLQLLSLVDNPIEQSDHYRLWVVWRLPQVRILDYARVTDKEREMAHKLFGTEEAPTELTSHIVGLKSRVFDIDGGGSAAANGSAAQQQSHSRAGRLTPDERARIEAAIKAAKSMDEISRLETMLVEGRIPQGASV